MGAIPAWFGLAPLWADKLPHAIGIEWPCQREGHSKRTMNRKPGFYGAMKPPLGFSGFDGREHLALVPPPASTLWGVSGRAPASRPLPATVTGSGILPGRAGGLYAKLSCVPILRGVGRSVRVCLSCAPMWSLGYGAALQTSLQRSWAQGWMVTGVGVRRAGGLSGVLGRQAGKLGQDQPPEENEEGEGHEKLAVGLEVRTVGQRLVDDERD